MHNFESPKKQDESYPPIKTIKPDRAPLQGLNNLSDGLFSARTSTDSSSGHINISNYLSKVVEASTGRKYDSGKPRYSLLPALALEEIVKVLTYGSTKYEDFNWMKIEQPNDRFFSAAQRHIWSWQKGEKTDLESKTNHLANAITNLMFILELELAKESAKKV